MFCQIEERPNRHHEALHKSLDCSIMDLADDISYGVHDLEDATALGLILKERFIKMVPEESCSGFLYNISKEYADEFTDNPYRSMVDKLFGEGRQRKRVISLLAGYFVMNCDIKILTEFSEPLLKYRAFMNSEPGKFLKALKEAVAEEVIFSPSVQQLVFKGQKIVIAVFEALNSEPDKLLAKDAYKLYEASEEPKTRVICDHISGMTDTFLLKIYERLYSPRMGSIFDKL